MCTKMSIVSIFVLVSILKNVYGRVENSELVKATEETQRVDIAYILNPLTQMVVVLCRANIETLHLKIICLGVKDALSDEKNNFDGLKVGDKCSRSKYSNWYRCSQVVRTISWKGMDISPNFNCSCLARQVGLEDNTYKASVKIINYERKVKKNTVLRKKVSETKNIHLHCYITGLPTPEITWYRDNVPLSRNKSTSDSVRYRQKNDGLAISRTDVRGSGNYRCFARNTAGKARGGIYQVEVFESRKNISDVSEMRNGITEGNFTGAKFIKTNETVDNKEEDQDMKQNIEGARKIVLIVVCCICSIILLMIIVIFAKRKKYLPDENTTSSQVVGCSCRTKSDCKLIVALPELLKLSRDEENEEDLDLSTESYFKKCQHTENFSGTHILSLGYQLKSRVLHDDVSCVVGTSSNEDCTLHREFEELLTKVPDKPSYVPSLPSPSYCSFLFEDSDVFAEDKCRHSQDSSSSLTELNVDTTNNDICIAPLTLSGRSTSTSSPNFSTKSETSALMDKLITIPPNADERYFASALIDHNGGEVILEDTGIKLIIPEGALDVGKTEAVYLALVGNPEYIPQDLNSDESLLSPVVLCGPHGLCFKKHVLLILPHCVAVSEDMERQFRVLCSNTAPETGPDWKEIFNQKEKPNEEVFCYMRERNFSLFVQHFTWYTITGEGSARKFSLRAYHTSFHQPNEEFKVRVYFIPILSKCNQCQKNVDEAESKLQGRLSDAPKTKIFHKRGGDVKVETCDISEGWKLIGENIQTEGYNELRLCHEEPPPNLTFRFQHIIPRPQGMSFKLTVFQEKCAFDTPVDISVSVNFEAERKRAEYQTNNYRTASQYPSVTASSSGYAGSGDGTTALFIPTGLRKELMKCLDKEIVGRPNWKMLAEHLGYKVEFIQWLDSGRFSPTERLLMEWETNTEQSPAKALRSLEKILWKMERVDAALKIQDYLEKLFIRKETTV